MKISLLFLFFSFFYSISQSQINYIKYKNKCEKAYDLAIDKKEFQKSINYLENLNRKYKLLGEEFFLKAYCYKNLNNLDSCASSLKQAYGSLFLDINITFPTGIKEIDPLKLTENFNENQLAVVQEGYQLFFSRLNQTADSLLVLFEGMLERDQNSRDILIAAEKNYNDSTSQVNLAKLEMRKVDLENQRILKELILKYGYPGYWLCPQGQGYLSLLLLHSTYEEFYKEMKPILLEELKKGHIGASDFANWEERYFNHYHEKSLYSLEGQFKPSTIPSKRKALKMRKKIGLSKHYPWTIKNELKS